MDNFNKDRCAASGLLKTYRNNKQFKQQELDQIARKHI